MKQKQLLTKTLLLLAVMLMGVGTAWAEDFTLSSASSVTQNGITVSFAKGGGSTAPAWYDAGLRLYASNTVTISSSSTITGITFNWEKQGSKAFASATANVGTYSHPSAAGEGTWTGSANEVVFTIGSSGQLQLNTFSVTVSGSVAPTCATPTFSPAAGAVASGTTVSISSITEDVTIYYTTDGTMPTTSSSVYSTPIEITAATTIKAFATKSDYNDSEVATAEYTIKQAVSGYTIDFENDIDCYVDWVFTNVGNTNDAISAHGGSKYGANINDSGNGTQTLSIQTKEKVALPEALTCYVSKVSTNTTVSAWTVSVSSDGTEWIEVATQEAQSMSKGEWIEFTANLSSYSDVYVRITYGSSSAIRAIDDITITERDPNAKVTPTVVIDASGLTTDLAGETNVSAGTATAAVMDGQTAVENVSVTWSSSNTGVATIDATTGAVTLIATGTTTLTATFAGNDDYNEATGTYSLTVIDSYGPGSVNNPFTVAEAIAAVNNNTYDPNQTYYINGIVSSFYNESIVGDGNNCRYYISDDGTTTTQLLVYKGKGLNQTAFSNIDDLLVGDEVVIVGKLMVYNSAPEVASGNYLYSLNRKAVKYYLVGSFDAEPWIDHKIEMTKSGNTYSVEKAFGANTLFKILKIDETNNNETTWYGGATNDNTYGIHSGWYENIALTAGDSGKNFLIEEASDDKYTFTVDASNPDAPTLTVTGWHVPVVKYYLAGNWTNDWSEGKVELTENADGTFSTSMLVGNGTRFKFVKDDDGVETWYGANQTGDDYGINSGWCTDIALSDASNASAFVIQIAADATLSFKLDVANMTFDVAGWPVYAEGNVFQKVTSNDNFTDGAYLIVYEDGNVAFDGSIESTTGIINDGNHIDVTILNNTIVADATTKASLFYIQNGTIKSASGLYIGRTSDSNGMDANDETVYTNTISIDADGNAVINSSGNAYLRYNSSTTNGVFRYYKSATYAGQKAIQLYKLVTVENVPVSISAAGYATYCSEYALDFSDTGLTAYKATIANNKVSFTPVTEVPAGEGVLLKGAEGTYDVPVIASAGALEGNAFIGAIEQEEVAAPIFVLMNGDAGVGFYKTTLAFTVGANTAYLPANVAGARSFIAIDEATAIESIAAETMTNGDIYNLQGQRVVKAQKGLYIINGKKVVIK